MPVRRSDSDRPTVEIAAQTLDVVNKICEETNETHQECIGRLIREGWAFHRDERVILNKHMSRDDIIALNELYERIGLWESLETHQITPRVFFMMAVVMGMDKLRLDEASAKRRPVDKREPGERPVNLPMFAFRELESIQEEIDIPKSQLLAKAVILLSQMRDSELTDPEDFQQLPETALMLKKLGVRDLGKKLKLDYTSLSVFVWTKIMYRLGFPPQATMDELHNLAEEVAEEINTALKSKEEK